MKLGERKRILSDAAKRGANIVLYLVEDVESAQFRYRCKNVMEAVDGDNLVVVWFLKSEIEEIDLRGVNLVVIERQTDKDGVAGRFIGKTHKMGVKVVFDLDDLIFDYRDLPLLMQTTNSKNVFYWMGYFWGVRRIAKKVDGFICTNEFLAGKLKRSFGKPVKVIRNSLNREQIEVSEKWVKKKTNRKEVEGAMGKSRVFSIGYFSGSPTHVKDFRLVEDDLVKFLDSHDDVVLKVVGYMEFSTRMKKMVELGRVEVTDLVDYLRLQGLMSKVDVNIAPLVINDFTNCKSELKFFEAAAVETTTIASPTYAFKRAISDGENGFLAQSGEWYDKLEYLYEDPKENRKVAVAAKKYALKHYYGEEFLREVEAAYGYFAK